jgi:prevent-host-death family protein
VAQYNVHEAKTNFSQLLEMAERGEEVIVARHGKPVVQLVPINQKKSILGIGAGDPNFNYNLPDEAWFEPMSEEDLAAWYGVEDS